MSKNVSKVKRIACLLLAVSLVLFVPQNMKAAEGQKLDLSSLAGNEQKAVNMTRPAGTNNVRLIRIKEDIEIDKGSNMYPKTGLADEDSVFEKGATDKYRKMLTKDGQKEYYDRIDSAAKEFNSSGRNISPTYIDIGEGDVEDIEPFYVVDMVWYSDLNISSNEAYVAYMSYWLDHPAYYWINLFILSNDYDHYMYISAGNDYWRATERKKTEAKVEKVFKEYAALAENGSNTLDKIAIVHDKICSDISYAVDYNGDPVSDILVDPWAFTVGGVAERKMAVCQGYSAAFSLTMNLLGIDNYNIRGLGKVRNNWVPHQWNAVYDDGAEKWLYMDLTWDDHIIDPDYCYYYFGMPVDDFANDHQSYSPSGDIDWNYAIDTTNFNNSFEGTYYYRGGFYYTGDPEIFAASALVRANRYGDSLSFIAKTEADVKALYSLYGVSKDTIFDVRYGGTNYIGGFITIKGLTLPIDNATITLPEDNYAYTGSAIEPEPTVTSMGAKLAKGIHYDVNYADNIEVGTGKVTVTGKGRFDGTSKNAATFTITDSVVGQEVTLSSDSFTYNEAAQRPAVTVTHKGATLTEGTDYTLTYSNPDSKDVGEYTITVTGKGNFTGTQSFTYKITPAEITKLTLKKTEFVYDSKKTQKATVSAVYAGNIKLSAKDYTLAYSNKNSKKPGTYKITVTGKGNFTGEITQKYYIKKANTLKVKAKTLNITEKDLKGGSKTFATSKIYNFHSKGQGKLTYAKKSGNAKITVAKNGKVKIAKGLKKGKYTVKINVTAAGNGNYAPATKTVSLTVKVSE